MFFDRLSAQYNICLDPQQKEAVRHFEGPALVLAGPGSGKTTVIVSRTAYLVLEAGISPENILTVTFNKAASNEMSGRFHRVFGSSTSGEVHFSTIHSFCNKVLMNYEKMRGKRLKRIEGNNESEESKRKIIRNLYYQINETALSDDELETLLSELSLVKNSMIKELEGTRFTTRKFPQIYKAYEEYKKENFLVDFDDMLTYAYSILNRVPGVLQAYRERYKYIQVDEGQDMSAIQFEIVKLLVGSHNNIFIVADDDQSIYGFRGAEPGHILAVEKEFPGCRLYRMENNYRSASNIVEISSRFIKRNCTRYDKRHTAVNGPMEDPAVIQPRDENSQISCLIERIREIEKLSGKTVGILYRNNLSSIVLADAFHRHQIRFGLKQNRTFFFSHWAVLDILAFLRFALDQRDVESFSRICFRMNRFLSRAMVEHALSQEVQDSVLDNIRTFPDLKSFQLTRIEGVKEEFGKLARMSTAAALSYIENDFKYFESVKEYCEASGISFEYIYGLFGTLKTLAVSYPSIPVFLQGIRRLEGILGEAALHKQEGNITLSTIHSAKGLEYDFVFMVDMTQDEIPGRKAADGDAEQDAGRIEEERRLFYVGMTRAREKLFLICPQYINGRQAEKSVFISEAMGAMNKQKADLLSEGTLLQHRHFGKGMVTSIFEAADGRITIEIDFAGVRKKFDFNTCMESGLIAFGE